MSPFNPFLLDIHTLKRQAGTLRHVEQRVEVPQEWGDEWAGLPANSPLTLIADLEAAGEGVLVTGRAQYRWTGQCARCLIPLERAGEAAFQELFVYQTGPTPASARRSATTRPHHAGDHGPPGSGSPSRHALPPEAEDEPEYSATDGQTLDLAEVVHDAVLLDLPWAPVCEDDCAGLCVDCGANLNVDPSHTHTAPIDARWAGLAGWVPSGRTTPGDGPQ